MFRSSGGMEGEKTRLLFLHNRFTSKPHAQEAEHSVFGLWTVISKETFAKAKLQTQRNFSFQDRDYAQILLPDQSF